MQGESHPRVGCFSMFVFFLIFTYLLTYLFIYLFIIFGYVGFQLWHMGSFIEAHGLLSSCGAWGAHKLWSVWTPEHMGSVVVACGLSCPVACGILVPRPGIEPTSPALEGEFLATGLPGKPPASPCFDSFPPSSLFFGYISGSCFLNIFQRFQS